MITDYYLRNNVALAVGVIRASLNIYKEIDMARIAVVFPLIFDEHIVKYVNNQNIQHTFDGVINANKISLANYNSRYLSILPLFYGAVSMLLDVNAITMSNGSIVKREIDLIDSMINASGSQKLLFMDNATKVLLKLIEGKNISRLYKQMRIEL